MERNEECWCGSGKKYKKCHLDFDKKIDYMKKQGYKVPKKSMIKNEKQIEGIKLASEVNNGLLDEIENRIHIGMTTEEIDQIAVDYLAAHGATSADLGYMGYPKSLCTSVNDEVCHGIPNEYVLKDGDIVNVDCTSELNGFYADASRMFLLGNVSDEAKRLSDVTKECLEIGMATIKPWKSTIADIGIAIEKHANKNGYTVVREFCGHGVGLSMHEDPYVEHYNTHRKGTLLVPGMVITIEPMINQGSRYLYLSDNEWTAHTVDGKLSAQWEHTLVVTETGIEILSK